MLLRSPTSIVSPLSPRRTVPATAFSALWLAVARELDDEFFGLDRRSMKVRNEESWGAQVRRRLRGSVADAESWPVFEQLAIELDTTAATLRRRLEREGTSYQAIKDQLRSDIAIDYLCNGNLSVDEIGARIGFQDASAFHRAFKRWNGVQPGEYRRRRLGDEQAR